MTHVERLLRDGGPAAVDSWLNSYRLFRAAEMVPCRRCGWGRPVMLSAAAAIELKRWILTGSVSRST